MRVIALAFLALTVAATDAGEPKSFDLPAQESRYTLVQFPAKTKAQLSVKSDKDGDVDLFVIDAFGKIVAKDTSVGKDCKLEFATKDEQIVLVKVANLGPGANRCTLTHNGKETNAPLQPLVKLAGGEKQAFFRYTPAGNVASLRAGFKANVSMSIYGVDNLKIASQPNFVAWENKGPKIVRVVLANNGKDEASTRLIDGADSLIATPMPAFDLEQGAKKTFDLKFPVENIAAIWVTSEKNSDVDLMVYDDKGKEVVSDITIGKDCFVGWRLTKAATYRVVVINHGEGANRCTLKHTGK